MRWADTRQNGRWLGNETGSDDQALERSSYRKVYRRLWANQIFRQLTDAERVVTLYVITGPQTNRIGIFRFSLPMCAEDLARQINSIRRQFAQVVERFGWMWDPLARVVYVPSWWKWNPPPPQMTNFRGALTDLNDVPQTDLLDAFGANVGDLPTDFRSVLSAWRRARHSSTLTRTDAREGQGHPAMTGKSANLLETLDEESSTARALPELPDQTKPDHTKKNVSSAPPSDAKPPVLVFPTVGSGPKTWDLSETRIAEWQVLYPGMDVLAECRQALAWTQANQRKTASGMPRFLVNWFNRAVRSGGTRHRAQPAAAERLEDAIMRQNTERYGGMKVRK